MAKKIVLYCFLAFLTYGCSNKTEWHNSVNSVPDLLEAFPKTMKLNGTVFINDTIHLRKPFDLRVLEDLLIVKDNGMLEDKFLQVYCVSSGNYLGSFINHGRGVNEFLNVEFAGYERDTLFLTTKGNRILLFANNSIRDLNPTPDRIINLKIKNNGDVAQRCLIKDGFIYASGFFKESRIYKFDLNGKLVSQFGKYPDVFANVTYDNYHLGYIYGAGSSFALNSNTDITTCLDANSMVVYNDTTISFSVQWNVPPILEASYKGSKPYVLQEAIGNFVGAGRLAFSKNNFYFPVSKWEIIEILELSGIENYFDYVLNFENERPKYCLELDMGISESLCIDKDGKYLYGIHTDGDTGFSQIVRFEINVL